MSTRRTINIQEDALISIEEAARGLPDKPKPATKHNWFTKGVGGKRLEVVKIGGKVYTTDEAFSNFASPGGVADDGVADDGVADD